MKVSSIRFHIPVDIEFILIPFALMRFVDLSKNRLDNGLHERPRDFWFLVIMVDVIQTISRGNSSSRLAYYGFIIRESFAITGELQKSMYDKI